MSNENRSLWFKSGLDNSQLKRDINQAGDHIKGLSEQVQSESSKMDSSFSGIGAGLAAIGGTAAIGMLGKQILDTTAKFEKFGIVLKNTLGDVQGQAALDMLSQFAATTPFQLDEVTGSFIKMANQGFVPTREEMVKLGDVASSTGKSFDQLTEALLDAQTGQFERLKEFGIKASAQGDKVTFSFKEQQTTVDNTNSAIQKYILSLGDLKGVQGANALISASLTGQLSNLEDKLAAMYNNIGKSNSGFLYAAVGGVTSLIDNYETVGKVVFGLIAVYGAYKATVLIVNAVSALQTQVAYQQMLANIGNTGATIQLTTAQGLQAIMASNLTRIQLTLNKSMLANPYVLAAMAITTLVIAMSAYANSAKEAKTQKEMLNDLEGESQKNTSQEVSKLESLKKILNDSNKSYGERKVALDKLKEIVPDYHANLTNEGILINNNSDALDTYVKKLVIAEKIKIAAVKQSNADEAFNNYKTENADVLKTAVKKKFSGQELFAGEAGALSKLTELAKEAQNYGSVIDQLQADLVAIDAKAVKKPVSKTPAQIAKEQQEADKKFQAEQEAAKALLKLKRDNEDAVNNAKQAEIDNNEDGFLKEMAQLDLNHKKKLQQIARQEEDLLIQVKESALKEFEAKGGKKGNFKDKNIQLTPEQKKSFTDQTTQENVGFDKTKKDSYDKLIQQYADYHAQLEKIEKDYLKNKQDLENTLKDTKDDKGNIIKAIGNPEEVKAALAVLEKLKIQSIKDVNIKEVDSITQTTDLFVSLFSDMSDKSVKEIEKILSESKKLFTYLKTTKPEDINAPVVFAGKSYTPEQLKNMQNDTQFIGGLNNANNKGSELVKGVSGGSNDLVNAFKAVSNYNAKSEKSVQDQLDLQKALSSGYATLSGYAQQAQGLLNAISTEEGDAADQASKSIGAVMKIADATVQPLLKGDYVGAAIGFVTSTLTQIFESEKAHQQALKKLQAEKLAAQKQYNDALMKQNDLLKNAETIYGTDAFAKSIGYAQVADKTRNKANSAVGALSGATVQTGSHKGGLFGWGGEVADYSSLTKTYKDLINADGTLNKERAQAILDNEKLNESSKAALQSALQYTTEYEDALKSMKDYLQSVFGSLGNDMMTAITSNLNSSQDAMDAFGKSAGKTIEKLMSDIAYSMFFADKFKKMQDQALAIQADGGKTPEQKAAEQTKLLGDFYAGIGNDVKSSQDWLKQNKDMAAKSGFDLWNEASTRTATSKGFASISQDSADELNGRFTAMQGHTFSISEGMKILQNNSAQALKHLAGIETNTARLEAVENNIISVKNGIDRINEKGVKLI